MMHMTFWWGDDLGDFFIKGFTINSPRSMTLLCFTLFVLSIAVEGLKVGVMFPESPSGILKKCFSLLRYTELVREPKLRERKPDLCLALQAKMRLSYQPK